MPSGAIPFPFGDCRVCADKATGVHYGVATCEGCKGFFKRSISKAEKYKCFHQGKCTLSPHERNRCKLCRFRRCLDVGMSIDGVKMGRIPKLEKEKALEEHRKEQELKLAGAQVTERRHSEDSAPARQVTNFECHSLPQLHSTQYPIAALQNKLTERKSKNKAKEASCLSRDSGIDGSPRELQKEKVVVTSCQMGQVDTSGLKEPVLHGSEHNFDVNGGCHQFAMTENKTEVLTPHGPVFIDSDQDQLELKLSNVSVYGELQADQFSSSGFINYPSHSGQPVTSEVGTVKYASPLDGDQALSTSSICKNDITEIADNFSSSPSSSSLSSSSSASCSNLPFYPTVIKELLNQVIETGHVKELQQNLVRQFLSASDSVEWRPESWIECFNCCPTMNGDFPKVQLPGSAQWEKGKAYDSRSLKRKSNGTDAYRGGSSCGDIKRLSQSQALSCRGEHAMADNMVSSFTTEISDNHVNKDTEISGYAYLNGTKNNDNSRMYTTSDDQFLAVETRNLENGSSCHQQFQSSHSSGVNEADKPLRVYAEMPGASCPHRLQRLKKMEFMASRVPQLTFWDIPDNTFEASSTAQSQNSELGQCKKEIEQVVEWLNSVGQRFMEKSRLDLSMWEEEVAGQRPVHPLNLLTNPTQKDIVTYWEEVVACVPLCNFLILGLCSCVPGFNQLDCEDRAMLMEASYFDLFMILLSSLFHDGDCFLRLVCEARYSRFWMQIFMPEKLLNGMFHFAEELNSCRLTASEHIILCAIQLTSKVEHDKMKNPRKAQKLHDYYLDLLAYQIERTHKNNHSRVLIKIFQLLPMLTPIAREQLELTSMLQVDHPPDVVPQIDSVRYGASSLRFHDGSIVN